MYFSSVVIFLFISADKLIFACVNYNSDRLNRFRQYIEEELKDLYPQNEIRSFYYLMLEFISGNSRSYILANKNNQLSEIEVQKLKTFVDRLKNFEPIQYIFGETFFYGSSFIVDKNVLIPRPETEELVDWIITDHAGQPNLKVMDIGTGSGCIAISLAKHLLQSSVLAVDISAEALKVAMQNALNNKAKVDFHCQDVLSDHFMEQQMEGKLDIVVSNHPYICEKEKIEMEPNVLKYEPFAALFVSNEDPLVFYEKIAAFAKKNIVFGGKLYFEINQAYGNQTVELLKRFGFEDIELKKDLYNRDRMIKAINYQPSI
jgi:release factor glutamine methyltransferase